MGSNYDTPSLLSEDGSVKTVPKYPSGKSGSSRDDYALTIQELRKQGYVVEERMTAEGPKWFITDPFDVLDGGF